MGPDDILPNDAGAVVDTPAVEPVSTPAPEAPVVSTPQEPAKPVSARDSVRAAFEKLSKEPQGDEPRPGEPAKPAAQANRDLATGRFVAKSEQDQKRLGAVPDVRLDGGKRVAGAGGEPGQTPTPSGPPPGWSVASKAAWDALPQNIRADIEKREGEVAQGLAALRDFRDVKPYAEMAAKSGTTLAAALQRYTTMEQMARRDPAQGMMAIAKNMGLSQAQAGQLFAHLAGALGARPTNGHQPNGGRQPFTSEPDQNDPLAEVIGPLIERAMSPMAQKLGTLETHLTRAQQADQNAQLRNVSAAIETFATDPKHRYFPELEETISRLFESGMVERTADAAGDLTKAYEMAAQLHPEVRETLVSERLKAKEGEARAKADAARRAAVSLNGHPPGGAAALARPAAGMSAHDSVRAAFQQLRSGV